MNDRPDLGRTLPAGARGRAGPGGTGPAGPPTPAPAPAPSRGERLANDIGASLVVFLVALPLCVGIAVASGVPPERGLITGIVGGLLVGCLPGSTFQVSGPAAGLTVLVASLVADHGLGALGVMVLGAGLIQVAMGVVGLGTWFRAVCPSVVQGMLGGIGLVLIVAQAYAVGGEAIPEHIGDKLAGLPGLVATLLTEDRGRAGLAMAAVALGTSTLWSRHAGRLRQLPGPLVGVTAAAAIVALADLPLRTVELSGLSVAMRTSLGDLGAFGDPAIVVGTVTIALVASAESLFSAAAVDRLHNGPRTRYNAELMAQGVGNAVCGLLGALPITAVIVRSSVNVRAGAHTRLSRILHGAWLLLLVTALPGVVELIPMAVLAALLVHAGYRLLELRQLSTLAREHPADAAVVVFTALAIAGTDLLIGTLAGLAAAVVKAAWELSQLTVIADHGDERVRVQLRGNATFLRLPRLLVLLDTLPTARPVHIDLTDVRHLDRGCRQAVEHWAAQRGGEGTVEVSMPSRA